jgi:hypothetical protein
MAPIFLIGIATAPADDLDTTPETVLETSLLGIRGKISFSNWEQSAREHGRINDLKFVRTRWDGDRAMKSKMHGVMYSAKDGSRFIEIASYDDEPNDGPSLKLADAAAATFKRK